jgi:two-component system phosphate regulon response regulator PhoB
MATTNILLVEDEPVTQELLAFNLTQCGFNAISAFDATSAIAHIRHNIPDLILLDCMLPDISGIELTRRLRAERLTRNIPIIMLTGLSDEKDKLLGFESGVDDYVTKPFSTRELMARIRAVLRNSAGKLCSETVYAGGLELSLTSHRVSANGSQIDLGPTEFNILHFLMTHVDRVYSRSQLLCEVWEKHANIEDRTVDVHIRRLRQALEPSGFDSRVQTVRGSGYCFRGE